jgi:hypothetical protein
MSRLNVFEAEQIWTAMRYARTLASTFVLTIVFTVCAWADSYTLSINGGPATSLSAFSLSGNHEFSFSVPVNETTGVLLGELKTDQANGTKLPSVVVDVYSGTSALIAAYTFVDAFVDSITFVSSPEGSGVTATVKIGYRTVERITTQQVTSESTGPVSGILTVSFPEGPTGPMCARDVVSFTGIIHVVTMVDMVAGTVDAFLNFPSVKGEGNNGQYVVNGEAVLLGLPWPNGPVIVSQADLHPPGPCQAGFNSQGALPLVVSIGFSADGTVSRVSAAVQVFD